MEDKKVFEYKGYKGSNHISKEDDCLWGKVLGIQSLLMYEGKTTEELEKSFKKVVDEYLENCESSGEISEIPFQDGITKGAGIVLLKSLAKKAQAQGIEIRKYIAEAIEEAEILQSLY